MNKLKTLALPLLGGFFYALGFPSFLAESIWIAPIIGYAILFNTLGKRDGTSSFLKVLAFSAGFNFLGFYWIPHTIHVFGELPIWIAFFLGIFFSIIILPQLWAFIFIKYLLSKFSRSKQFLEGLKPTQTILFFSILMTALEYFTPQQFPAHIGHGWLIFPSFIGLATTFGATLYSFINFLTAKLIVDIVQNKRVLFFPAAIIIVLLVLSPLEFSKKKTVNKSINLRIVQANIGNFMKIHAERGGIESINEVFKRYYKYSTVEPNAPIDLIIWPETAFPYSMITSQIKKTGIGLPKLFKTVSSQMNAQMLFGGYDRIEGSSFGNYFQTEYNSAIHIDNEAKILNAYHKQVLIPFGETLPFPSFINNFLADKLSSVSFFAQGSEHTKFETRNNLTFMTPICYEILYSDFIREYYLAAGSPDFMINLTNDSWYGDTSEPHQHLFLAKWRAIEFKTPIVRTTNTGITSVHYPDGSESKRLGVFEQNNLDIKLEIKNKHHTLFAKYGMLFNYLLWFILFGLSFLPILGKEILLSKDHAA